ncbi:AMP-dependent synthetase [Bacteroidia bacterium]|nr:AMP-dependent synthetase [Bacteroidia bacterium]
MKVTRLFDILPYVKETYGNLSNMVNKKMNGQWQGYTTDEFIDSVDTLSYGLLDLGLQPGDTVAIISSNRPEWNFLDLAVQQIGAIPVPIYPTISESEYDYILNHADVKLVFSEGAELLQKLEHILHKVPSIKEIFTFIDRGEHRYLAQLFELGRQHPQPALLQQYKDRIRPDDTATIIFTSGTTGVSKGVMLTHSNIILNIDGLWDVPKCEGAVINALSFLPLCHVYERTVNYLYFMKGYHVYYAENAAAVATTAQEIQPQIMVCVPRIFEKLYDKIYTAGEKMPLVSKWIYYWAIHLALRFNADHQTRLYRIEHAIADKLVYKKLRDVLGGNIRLIISGGAAIQERLARFFLGIGLPFIEGYGMTETSPVIAVNLWEKGCSRIGTVGFVLKDLEVKIAKDNEILVRGYSVMKGYYKNPEETSAVIDAEGFLHTGDLGSFEDGKFLKIVGRKKSLFKTSFGKFVNPILIEDKFKESPFIDNMMVVGEGQKFAAAIITIDWEFLRGWWKRKSLGAFPEKTEALNHPLFKKRIKKEVAKYNEFFGKTEQIGKYTVIADEWSPETGELSQTLKLRRNLVEPHYKEQIEALFV